MSNTGIMQKEGKESLHILAAISGHGYGHLAQCAPVLGALKLALPELVVSICTALPHEVVAARLKIPFHYHYSELDPVLKMHSSWEVDIPGSRNVYRAFHNDWDAGVRRDKTLLEDISPGLILADIPYRLLVAAAELQIKAVALCSLNWADIYSAYCEKGPQDDRILSQIHAAYRSACCFLQPQPAMLMPLLENAREIGPIARQGRAQKKSLNDLCGTSSATRFVLVALGGIDTELPLACWPQSGNTVWLFASDISVSRHDMISISTLPMPFIDVLASSDVVLTKPGYGTYAEAVCNGIAVLSLRRDDWPETVALNCWANKHGHLECLSAEQFHGGHFMPEVDSLCLGGTTPAVRPSGIAEAVDVLRALLPIS